MAVWVISVCFSASSVPENIMSVIRKPMIWFPCSNSSFAWEEPSYSSFPIPVNCAPWPGNKYAFMLIYVGLYQISRDQTHEFSSGGFLGELSGAGRGRGNRFLFLQASNYHTKISDFKHNSHHSRL